MLFTIYVVTSFFFFKQKTAYEMRISDWSSDVCSSDLRWTMLASFSPMCRPKRAPTIKLSWDFGAKAARLHRFYTDGSFADRLCQIGRASCRERVCQYV